ncbi:protein-disulfide reductase DsbD [Sulfurovum riftiae]|uniref:Disulfide bond formation protein DsbD n=1 Tax=Sulfurovum riftiae TaxID=1630136 RepID=A0A151CII1_9BACT|nr:protein-disulfide reductase DsbD [Sulfurovum riftiae]KYJ87321.1 disulfide bond formation protein DsbD [Sulfurovum riftiae]
MQNLIKKLLILSLLFNGLVFGGFSSALKKNKFLQPEEAFQISAVQKDDMIETKITLADKIHIYKDDLKYRIVSPQKVDLKPVLPPAHEFDGDKVYEKELVVTIPVKEITQKVKGDYTLEIEVVGCSDKGICYQPFRKSFTFKGAEAGFFDKISSLTQEGNTAKIADVLGSESSLFIIILFFIFGLLLALTPCVFPMIPILSSIIVSQSGNEKPSMGKAFFTSLVYVVAMALTYTVVGVVAGLLGADIQTAMQNPWVLTAFAAMFVALAFSLFGYYELGLPASWQSKISAASDEAGQKGGIAGTAIMGLLSALIVGPCVAPPLGGAVLFISHTGDALLGGVALFVMSMGMGMPLLLVGIGAGKFMPKPGGWMTTVSQVFGVMMLGLGIFMLSRILPDGVTLMLWSLLFIGSALYMGVFDPGSAKKGMKKLIQLLAVVFMLYGSALFVGAISGASSMLRPFEKFTSGGGTAVAMAKEDKANHRGYSIDRLMKEVAASDKPVVVDFGKDSCTACTELEEITFPDPKVQEALKKFTFIKIDLTDNTEDDKALLKKFELFGTPNIIFFDKENNYLPEKSLTGFIKPNVFAEHLKEVSK